MGDKVLIATLGESAEVVTEVLDKLLAEKEAEINRVRVVRTQRNENGDAGNADYILVGGESSGFRVHRVWRKGIRQDRSDQRPPHWSVITGSNYVKHRPGLAMEFVDDYRYLDHDGYEQHSKVIFSPPATADIGDIHNPQDNAHFARKLFATVLDETLQGNEVWHLSKEGKSS